MQWTILLINLTLVWPRELLSQIKNLHKNSYNQFNPVFKLQMHKTHLIIIKANILHTQLNLITISKKLKPIKVKENSCKSNKILIWIIKKWRLRIVCGNLLQLWVGKFLKIQILLILKLHKLHRCWNKHKELKITLCYLHTLIDCKQIKIKLQIL